MSTVLSGNWWADSGQPAPSAALQYVDANGATNLITFSVVESEDWTENAEITEHPVEQGANVADHVRVELVKCSLKVFNSNEPITQGPGLGISAPDVPTRGPIALEVPVPSWSKSNLTLQYPIWINPIQARALLQAATGTVGNAVGGRVGSIVGSAVGGLLGALLLSAHAGSAIQHTTAGLTNVSAQAPGVTLDVDQWAGQTDYVHLMHQLLLQLKNSAQLFTVLGTKNTQDSMAIDSLSFSRTPETGSGERVTISFKQIRQVSTQTVAAPIPNLPAGGGNPPVNHGGQDPAPTESASAAHVAVEVVGAALGSAVASVFPSFSPTSAAP